MFQFALSKLIRGNEIELAVSIGMVLKDNSQIYHLAVELLARKCEKLGKWYPIYLFIYLFIYFVMLCQRFCSFGTKSILHFEIPR